MTRYILVHNMSFIFFSLSGILKRLQPFMLIRKKDILSLCSYCSMYLFSAVLLAGLIFSLGAFIYSLYEYAWDMFKIAIEAGVTKIDFFCNAEAAFPD